MSARHALFSDREVAGKIQCILSDVDGVLSDGKLYYDSTGAETKTFHVRDGYGIKAWMNAGLHFGIITARHSDALSRRAKELGIHHVVQNSSDKWATATEMMSAMGVTPEQVCYIGDDVPDIAVMHRVALAAAPDDASIDAREAAHWITRLPGGTGAVRELIERLMRAADRWPSVSKEPPC
ncbi:HAD-IIIA family hydrolase [Rhodopirellula sp. JC737]|nr:HAD-IIIA family hydrolase [Rhodopirellula sp. JC737]